MNRFSGRLLIVAWSVALLAAACSGSDGGSGDDDGAGTPSPSGTETATPTPLPVPTLTETGFLYVRPSAYCVAGTASLSLCNTFLAVLVDDTNAAVVYGADVEIGQLDSALVLATDFNGTSYRGYQAGLGDTYLTNVTHGSASMLGLTFRSPADFTITIPALAAGASATIGWTPSSDAGVVAGVRVIDPTSNATYSMQGLADGGMHQIPGSAFPVSGSYLVEVSRRAVTPVPHGVFGNVTIVRRQTATVP